MTQPVVIVVMGSASDWPIMQSAGEMLDRFRVPYEVTISSAHRAPQRTGALARGAAEKGIKAIIAGAGGAAHLAGVIAAENDPACDRRAHRLVIAARAGRPFGYRADATRRAGGHGRDWQGGSGKRRRAGSADRCLDASGGVGTLAAIQIRIGHGCRKGGRDTASTTGGTDGMTRCVGVNPQCPSPAALDDAASVLQHGGIVAYLTDTVYGLAVDARQPQAIAALFALKGRSSDKAIPLIIGEPEQLSGVALDLPRHAEPLMSAFWPGPLTLLFCPQENLPASLLGNSKTNRRALAGLGTQPGSSPYASAAPLRPQAPTVPARARPGTPPMWRNSLPQG